jgi:hypothetical protein
MLEFQPAVAATVVVRGRGHCLRGAAERERRHGRLDLTLPRCSGSAGLRRHERRDDRT